MDEADPGGSLERWAPWLLAGAVLAAYANAFAGAYQFDDWKVVVNEPRVASLAAWWASMPGIRPLLKLSYALNHQSGLGLVGFHAVNVAVQVVNALLAFAVLARLGGSADASPAGSPGPRPPARAAPGPAGHPDARAAALVGALLFALHPAQTEAVTYVSGRSTSLSAAFALASLLAWLGGRERRRAWLADALSPTLLACSLLVKETAVVLPAALLLVHAAFGPRPVRWREALRATAGHWLVVAAALAAAAASPTYRSMVSGSLGLRGPLANLLTHLDATAWLAGQVVRLDRLNADPALPAVARWTPAIALEAAALGAAAAAGLLLLRRRPAAGFAVLWFLLWLAPSGWWLPRPEPANDRQLYLALLGPAWLAGRWVASLLSAGGWRRVASAAAAAGLVGTLGAATFARNGVYADEIRYWEDVAGKSPGSPRAHNNLGFALAARCRVPEAEAHLVRAMELDPAYLRAEVNLALLREGAPLAPGRPPCPGPSGERRRPLDAPGRLP